MTLPIQILILEDDEIDSELILHELRRNGFVPSWRRVDCERDFRDALSPELEMILADFTLPQFDALHALEILKESGLDIPFIVVTGALEERAVECMRRGASDYLLKDRLSRLGGAIHRALDEKELRRENSSFEQAMLESEARFRTIASTATDAIIILKEDGLISFCNAAANSIFGYTKGDLTRQNLEHLIPSCSSTIYKALKEGTGQDGEGVNEGSLFEMDGLRSSGENFPVELSLAEWQLNGEKSYTVIIRDISDRKRAEEALRESEQLFRTVAENAITGIGISDLQENLTYANPALALMLGYSQEELTGKNLSTVTEPGEFNTFIEQTKKRQAGKSGQYETKLKRVDGRQIPVLVSSAPLYDENKVNVGVLAIVTEITELKHAEESLSGALKISAYQRKVLWALSQAGGRVQRAHSQQDLFEVVGREIHELGHQVVIFTLDSERQNLKIAHLTYSPAILAKCKKMLGVSVEDFEIPLTENSLFTELITNPKPHFLEHAIEHIKDAIPPAVRPLASKLAAMLKIDRGIFAPLSVAGVPQGFLWVSGPELSEVDLEAISAFASQMAIAWENSTLFEEVRSSQEQYEGIFEGVQDAILCEDMQGRILAVNQRACNMFGYGRDELLQMNAADLVPDGYLSAISLLEQEGALSEGSFETVRRSANSDLLPVEMTIRVQPIAGKQVVLVVMRDISVRKITEASIERYIHQLEALRTIDLAITSALSLNETLAVLLKHLTSELEIDAACVLLFDSASRTLRFSAGLGFHTEALKCTNIPLGEGYAGKVAQSHQRLFILDLMKEPGGFTASEQVNQEGFRSYICLPLIAQGQLRGVLELFTRELMTPNDEWLEFLGMLATQAAIAIDNSTYYAQLEQHSVELEQAVQQATIELSRSHDQLDAILNNSPETILLLSPEGEIGMANAAARVALGFSAGELVGTFVFDLIEAGMVSDFRKILEKVFHSASEQRLELIALRKDTTSFESEISLSPITEGASVAAAVCMIRDVSAWKELGRMKDAFVSNVSHELRTPITSMRLHHSLLSLNPEKSKIYLERLDREITRLDDLIEDLLRLSRLDQGRVEMQLEKIDLNRMVAETVEDRIPIAESNGLGVIYNAYPETAFVNADEGLLAQVLSVLLTNAINYTPAGGRITVSVDRENTSGSPRYGFKVLDTGLGIDPEERSHLFERFFRGKSGRNSGAPGTGLGLAIAQEIMQLHHGRIEVHSSGVAGEGTEFSVWLAAVDETAGRIE